MAVEFTMPEDVHPYQERDLKKFLRSIQEAKSCFYQESMGS